MNSHYVNPGKCRYKCLKNKKKLNKLKGLITKKCYVRLDTYFKLIVITSCESGVEVAIIMTSRAEIERIREAFMKGMVAEV